MKLEVRTIVVICTVVITNAVLGTMIHTGHRAIEERLTAFETRFIVRLDSIEARLNARLDSGEAPLDDLGE